MAKRLTNNELITQNAALAAECAELRATLSRARVEYRILRDKLQGAAAPSTVTYPLTDARGRTYRMDGRIKCYAPAQ